MELRQLSAHHAHLPQEAITSLIYPCVLMTLVTVLVLFMFTYVVPQFATLYDQIGSKLPALTVDLLSFSKWLIPISVILLTLLIVGVGFVPLAITDGKDFVDAVRIRTPVLAKSGSSTRWRCLRAPWHAAHRRPVAGSVA